MLWTQDTGGRGLVMDSRYWRQRTCYRLNILGITGLDMDSIKGSKQDLLWTRQAGDNRTCYGLNILGATRLDMDSIKGSEQDLLWTRQAGGRGLVMDST